MEITTVMGYSGHVLRPALPSRVAASKSASGRGVTVPINKDVMRRRSEIADLRSRLAKCESDLSASVEALSIANAEIERLKGEGTGAVDKVSEGFNAKVEQLNEENAALKEQNASLKDENAKLADEVKSLKDAEASYKAQIRALKASKTMLENAAKKSKDEVSGLNAKIAELEDELAKAKSAQADADSQSSI